jgi:uracil-DNA glycosylase family 4
MSGWSERDAAFLAEMGLGPLWVLRAGQDAPAAPDGDAVAVADADAAPARASAPAPAPAQVKPGPVREAAQVEAPAAPDAAPAPRPGPRPLQRVAQSVSALEPVEPPAAAWDDAALPADATPEQIAAMGWDELQLAIASCRRCSACRDGRAPVPGTGARSARWLVAAGASTAADEKARVPLAGDPGKLLDNMLAAVALSRGEDVYITNLVKCRPATSGGGDRAPTADEAAACRPYLERELALTGAATVLTLGQIAANTLLGRPIAAPLAGIRGAVHPLGTAEAPRTLVATLHPGELLRRGGDKALAWADLCLARSAHGHAG